MIRPGTIEIENDYPLCHALCLFDMKDGSKIVGYMDWNRRDLPIKTYGRSQYHQVWHVDSYQYLLNSRGGFCFITENGKG